MWLRVGWLRTADAPDARSMATPLPKVPDIVFCGLVRARRLHGRVKSVGSVGYRKYAPPMPDFEPNDAWLDPTTISPVVALTDTDDTTQVEE